MKPLTIGELSRATEVKVPTIRFYEQIGLLPEPARTQSNRRVYGIEAMRRLGFIRRARRLGFTVDSIRDLLVLIDNPDRPCETATAAARVQLATVEAKIEQLTALRGALQELASAPCEGRSGQCPVLDALL